MNIQKAKKEAKALSLHIVSNQDKITAPFDEEWERLQYLRTIILTDTFKSNKEKSK